MCNETLPKISEICDSGMYHVYYYLLCIFTFITLLKYKTKNKIIKIFTIYLFNTNILIYVILHKEYQKSTKLLVFIIKMPHITTTVSRRIKMIRPQKAPLCLLAS